MDSANLRLKSASTGTLSSEDLAIDLGIVNTRAYARGRGIVVNQPSAVALDQSTGEVRAVGKETRDMLVRTPNKITVIKPLRDGVIADFRLTEKMLNYFIQKAHQCRTLVHPRVIISVPSDITQVERRAVTGSAYRPKAAEVSLGGAGDDGSHWGRYASVQASRQVGCRYRWRHYRERNPSSLAAHSAGTIR